MKLSKMVISVLVACGVFDILDRYKLNTVVEFIVAVVIGTLILLWDSYENEKSR